MRNSLITYLLGFFILVTCSKAISAIPSVDTTECLIVGGTVVNADEGLDQGCTVELFCSNTLVKTVVLKDGKKKFKFTLKKNLNYSIRITKKNHIPKLINVDTKMNKDPYGMKYFCFEIKMIETYNPLKAQLESLDSPIAVIYYDSTKDDFVHDKEYASKMKKEIVMK